VVSATAATDLWDYLTERLRSYFIDTTAQEGVRGTSTEMFDAVRASEPSSPLDFGARLGGAQPLPSHSPRPRASRPPTSASPTSLGRPRAAPGRWMSRCCARRAEKALHEALAGMIADVERALGEARLRAALDAARDLRPPWTVLRCRDGECRGCPAAPQPPGLLASCAAVHAHRGSFLPAGLTAL
jgi:hypothetical protein